MAHVTRWRLDDKSAVVDVLNANAVDFTAIGIDFKGWFTDSSRHADLIVVGDSGLPAFYAVVGLGPTTVFNAMNNVDQEEARESFYRFELVGSTTSEGKRIRIFKDALTALLANMPSTHTLHGSELEVGATGVPTGIPVDDPRKGSFVTIATLRYYALNPAA